MSTRLDLALKKHPDHEPGIRLLASRDPSGKLKYLDWGAKVLAAKQALAPEIADVIELFHRFNGHVLPRAHVVAAHQSLRHERIHPDIHTYRPQDLAKLRDNLLKIKRAADRKLRTRERLYRIEGAIEADTVYDSPDLIVRHIKNKNASVHYGLSTKWCISMLREGYFEDYEVHNATFFFFERKVPLKDEFDKVAVMLPRQDESGEFVEAFTALDRRVDTMMLAKIYGARVFDIFRSVYECSELYPGSVMAQVYAGKATIEQIEAVLKSKTLKSKICPRLLMAVACNDAATPEVLNEALKRAGKIGKTKKYMRRRMHRRGNDVCTVMAALAIHPNTSDKTRKLVIAGLRRRRINIDTIRRTAEDGVDYARIGEEPRNGRRRHLGYRRRHETPSGLRRRAGVLVRLAARLKKKAVRIEKKKKKR